MRMEKSKISSPCIKVCRLNDKLCVGCYRTIDEIREWSRMTLEEKHLVIDKCEVRKRDHEDEQNE